jgi:hypothetical protein
MNIQSDKLDIIQWLASVNDSKIIRQFMMLKRLNEEWSAGNVSQEEKNAIDKGLDSIREGRSNSHDVVTRLTREKYPRLFK